MLLEPAEKLRDRLRVFNARPVAHLHVEGFFDLPVGLDGFRGQLYVDTHAHVVEPLVTPVVLPLESRHRQGRQARSDSALHLHIANAVGLERCPVLHRVLREVPCAAAVALGCLAGLRKLADQVFTLGHLLGLQVERLGDTREVQRDARVCGPDHGAVPAARVQLLAQVGREAHPLELRVKRPLFNSGITQRGLDLSRQALALGKVHNLHRIAVNAVGEKQDGERRVCSVAVNAGTRQARFGVSLNIDTQGFHGHLLQVGWWCSSSARPGLEPGSVPLGLKDLPA